MKTRTWMTGAAVLGLLCGAAAPAAAQLAAAFQYVMENNLATFNHRDLDGTMRTVDTRSPAYAPTKAAVEAQFKDLDLTATLVDFDYMGHDDEFAVARAKIKTTGKPGSGFADNTVDAIILFHQEDGAWKLWSEQILAVDLVK